MSNAISLREFSNLPCSSVLSESISPENIQANAVFKSEALLDLAL